MSVCECEYVSMLCAHMCIGVIICVANICVCISVCEHVCSVLSV